MERGEPEVYSGDELRYIGMPVGGLFAGTVYLGGDGQLWNWDVFNQTRLGCVERKDTVFLGDTLNAMSGANYVDPVRQQSPFSQRFHLSVLEGALRRIKFGNIRFRGEYPVGKVRYLAADADVEMDLIAFSPFIPLDAESSSFPATTLTFAIRNTGDKPLTLEFAYELENPVPVYSKGNRSDFERTGERTENGAVVFGARSLPMPSKNRPPILFEDWSSGTYGSWVATGTAFGEGPQKVSELPSYMGPVHAGTAYVVNSHQTRNGEDVVQGDVHTGSLRSPAFRIERDFLNLRIGGGAHTGKTCVNLVVDGKVVRSSTGRNSNVMAWESWSVSDWQGKEARIEVVDQFSGGWGQISLGEVEFADEPRNVAPLTALPDFGTFCARIPGTDTEVEASADRGALRKRLEIPPGGSSEVVLIVAWHFPNCAGNLPGKRHWYASRWRDAAHVADENVRRWDELSATTLAWNRAWYDSNLPYWFLDRTFVNTSILATTTCLRLDEGRYWFWEGVGCCAGTCTHVWGYAQAIGRVFPEIERYLRKEIDFGRAYRKDTGAIDYRAEYHQTVAVDGQASCILRAYREHLMSRDDGFLKSIWPQVKGAMQHLIRMDAGQDGILDGAQYNTLDTAWYGQIAWISTLYVAALHASQAMADEMGDPAFAEECSRLAEAGRRNLGDRLFNGEYFVNLVDASHPEANNTNVGCHIDQVYGQSWACQVNLPRVVDADQSKKALRSLFRYNFFEDVWEYRRRMREIPGGRWYAAPSEAGLLMCTFPKGGAKESIGKGGDAWAVGYFNECMSGFEYQVASHMIAEGLVEQGLTIVRAIHERYAASKRNPYNEVECSDHYGRAMASYGAYVALAGFRCHGPRGEMSFTRRGYRGPFIAPDGWGTYDGKPTYAYRDGRLIQPL